MMRRHVLRGLVLLSIVSLALLGCDGGQDAKVPGSGGPTAPPRGGIQLTASVASIPADGASTSHIQAIVRDAGNDLVADGTIVTFEIDSGPLDPGGLSADSVQTTGGQALVTYTAGTFEGSARIRASADVDETTITSTITLTLQGVLITLTANPPAVQAGGDRSDITAQVRYAGGDPVPQGTIVAFETTQGILSAAQAVTNQTGLAAVTLTSSALPGTATVTATALGSSGEVDVNFTELPPTVRTIEMSTLESAEVGVLGSWESQTSEISFLAKDMFGDPVGAGYSIEFDILSGPDQGEQMFPLVAQTDTSGVASAVFTAGIQSGTVRVVARFRDNPTVVSSAVVITIRAGLPDGLNFGAWAELLNIAGLRQFNLEDPVTACPSDSFLNPVPDGTGVYFTTNYAKVNATATTTDGEAASKLTSQRPLPPDGFVTYEASTQGGILSRTLSIMPDPADATGNTIWVGTDGDGIYRTLDGGGNWLHVGDFSSGLNNGIVHDITLDPHDTRIVYAGTDGGVFKSVGGGAWEDLTAWKRITGEFLGTGVDPDADGASPIYPLDYTSTRQRARTRVYADGLETINYYYTSAISIRMIGDWTGSVITIDYDLAPVFPSQYPVNAIAIDSDAGDPLDSSIIYAGTGGGGVYKSEDGGFTWTAVNRGLSNQDVLCLILDAAGTTLYAGTRGGVFRSQDGGAIWTRHVQGLTDWVVQTLVEAGTRLVAGTATRGIFWTDDIGSGWTEATTNVNAQKSTNGNVTDIVAPISSVLYASTREGGVFRSSDGGATWTPLTNVFGESLGTGDGVNYIFPLADASNQDKPSTRVYVGADSLPYGGYNFQAAQAITLYDPPSSGAISADYVVAGYPSAYTYAVAVTPANVIFAGGNGRNVIKSTDSGSSWEAANGIGLHRIENEVYTTAKAVFSDDTLVRILSLLVYNPDNIAGQDDDWGIRLEGNNYGADYPVQFGGYETYFFTISDHNGNPLVGGSSFDLKTDCGSDVIILTGDLGDTIDDSLRGQTDYGFAASNDNTGDESETCTFTLTVTSEDDELGQLGNGNTGEISFSRTFWAKLKVDPAEASIKPDESQRLTGTGGSGAYAWSAPGAAVTSGTGETFVFLPTALGNFTVTVRDTRTGETAQSYITVKADTGT